MGLIEQLSIGVFDDTSLFRGYDILVPRSRRRHDQTCLLDTRMVTFLT